MGGTTLLERFFLSLSKLISTRKDAQEPETLSGARLQL